MRKIVLLICVLSLFIGCNNDFKERKYLGINGKARSIKDTKYVASEKFGEIIEQYISEIGYYEFDEYGQIKKMEMYDDDEEIIYSSNYKYENGKCIENKTYRKYDDISTVNTLRERKNKNEIWENKSSDGKIMTTFNSYENQKRITVTKDSEGNIKSKGENQFDKNGNIIERKYFNDEKVEYWQISKFNNKSQELEKKVIEGYDEGVYTYKYESFDEKGNWTKKIEYKGDEVETLTIRVIKYQ